LSSSKKPFPREKPQLAPNRHENRLPFNRASIVGRELLYLQQAFAAGKLSGNGPHTHACQQWLRQRLNVAEALLTHSCTAALELAALLCELAPGDEVIMPSFTYVSTASAVALRGAVPVFVDIRPDTFNIDEQAVEANVTPRTRAIFVVHYAGVCAEMNALRAIARRRGLLLVEDAAQALGSTYCGEPAGALADMAAFSFHETKNVVSGEGGALTLARPELAQRAYVLWEKGTNRREFHAGRVDEYTWVDLGSSFPPNEITAAVLRAQLEQMDAIVADRLATWDRYHEAFADLDARGLLRRPRVPPECRHNGHMYPVLLPDRTTRDRAILELRNQGIGVHFHYVPLHSSPAGLRYGRSAGPMTVTDEIAGRLLRLPLWYGIGDRIIRVIDRLSTLLAAQG
jgi:dTDP-4-amino-4,6-dideoxygalactose transaminase